MIEISGILLTLLIEGAVFLLIALVVIIIISMKKKKKDRSAASKLVDQIKHQSDARRQSAGAFLKDKYRLEGHDLTKAIEAIDKSEKRFFQKVINLYLKRDAEALSSLDATVAEMIDVYKSLSPVMPDANAKVDKSQQEELEKLREANANLVEELSITKETMANMIAEFGNMFGGGSDHELAKHEVVEKVQHHETDDENLAPDSEPDTQAASDVTAETGTETDEDNDDIDIATSENDEVTSDDDIDDILNGIEAK